MSNFGILFYCCSKFEKVLEYFKKYWLIVIELGDRFGEGYVLNYFGNMFYRFGLFMEVIEYYERSLKIVKEFGDRVVEEKVYGGLGFVF